MRKIVSSSVQTTSLVFNLQDIDFSGLSGKIKVYDLSRQLKQLNDYAKQQNYVKERFGDIPFYYNSPSKRVYALQAGDALIIKDNDREIVCESFDDFKDPSFAHCWINVLASAFTMGKGRVNHTIFYLLVRGSEKYARVLRLNLRHNYLVKGRYEILIEDSATRMRKYTKDEIDKKVEKERNGDYHVLKGKIFYKGVYTKNDLSGFRQTISKNIKKGDIVYLVDTNEKNRTKVTFHTIKSQEAYEKTRCRLLYMFTEELCVYLRSEWNIVADRKHLNIVEYKPHSEIARQILPDSSFKVTLVDGRIDKTKLPVQVVVDKIKSLESIHFKNKLWKNLVLDVVNDIKDIDKVGNYLLLMDYNHDDFDIASEDALFKFDLNLQDQYKIFKKNVIVLGSASQALCINENFYTRQSQLEKKDKDVPLEEWTTEKYLNCNVYKSTAQKKTFLRNYEVSINQLYLKSLVKDAKGERNIPLAEYLKDKVFAIRHTDSEGQQSLKIFYLENKALHLDEWDDSIIARITGRSETIQQIDAIRLSYSIDSSKAFYKNFILVISKDAIYEIKELDERVLYNEEELARRLGNFEKAYPKMNYIQYVLETKWFTKDQLVNFKKFVELDVLEEEIAYSKFIKTKGGYRKQLDEILGKPNKKGINKLKPAHLISYLKSYCNIDVSTLKKGGVLKHHQGIWFDPSTKQYFVGSKNPYKANQERGFQMRKIIEIAGTFNPDQFFPLLSVEFIQYGSYTVLPFPFTLMSYIE